MKFRMADEPLVSRFIGAWNVSPFGQCDGRPWDVVQQAASLIQSAIYQLDQGYEICGDIAVHCTATVEDGAVLKGPAIIGPGCFVAATAYLRGGIYLGENCIVGPACELKTSFMFPGSKIAHLNFVGDSLLGSRVNVEAGAIIANYRNELTEKQIRIVVGDDVVETGTDKFGCLVGDDVRIGANAVIAPGALLPPETEVGRLQLVDQSPGINLPGLE